MEEGSGSGGGGGEPSSSSRVKPSYVKLGDRQIFTVELRPGETTFVSWKKLVKDANKGNSNSNINNNTNVNVGPASAASSAPLLNPPPASAHLNLDSRIAPGQPAENEDKEAPAPNRFSAVIEKIERLYMGKDSSDEEDLKDVPDDDQYDTEDSFIDDTELNEYFEVDNSEIKHDGFFVNRGKLERISETTVVPNQQPKKRRRKDVTKSFGEGDEHVSNKSLKPKTRDIDKPKTVILPAKNPTNRPNDASGPSDVLHQKYQDKSIYAQSKLPSSKSINSANEVETSLRLKEKNGVRELPDLNSYPDSKNSMPVTKTAHTHRRDGSSIRPKSSMLEKSIRELEKMVAESRPPTLGNQEADASSQTIKRRLPREIKLKLAKVARLAGREGRISKELINRLMSILGHLIQLRTLKRNLKDMIRMGMRAKEEKDDRFQLIKKEVAEMIKTRVHSLETKAFEQQAGASDDFQELGSEEKGSLKQKFSMDAVLEDKICDLYDLFVEGLDEDAGPQVRRLYVELAGMWPTGFMDNHGIKRAICCAKERRRAMYNRYKDEDKIKRKKVLTPKIEETVCVDAGSVAQPQYMQDRLATDSGGPVLALASKSIPNATTAAVRLPSPSTNVPSSDRQKQEKPRVSSSNSIDEGKRKVKRKPEQELDESHFRTDKLHSQSSEERHKSSKHGSGPAQKLNLPVDYCSSFQQPS